MKEKPDWIFKCYKCEHQMYVGKEKTSVVLKTDCPECGEEAYENWILVAEGDYDKKYGK
jgi:DNA-directed RNA polymerase subunit RPC12/RpoP